MQLSAPRWITAPDHRASSSVRMFCFPYAGGSSTIFRDWPRYVGPNVEVCPIHLPGRGIRMNEPLITDLRRMVGDIAAGIDAYLDRPFIFFGHSMGALLAHELTLHLLACNRPLPRLLVVSGRQAPQVRVAGIPVTRLTDDQFRQELRSLSSETEQVLSVPSLRRLVFPILRADFGLCESWQPRPVQVLDIPIIALGGDTDPTVSLAMLEPWRHHTGSRFSMHILRGDHFFLHSAGRQICELIENGLDFKG